ncbi:MAG: hypothetical protein H7255_08865 [Ramlibacter sp.]|nr:hypothetical protein [Ramlibacter sp.]
MTASEKIERNCTEALARIKHSTNTRAGIAHVRVRELAAAIREELTGAKS